MKMIFVVIPFIFCLVGCGAGDKLVLKGDVYLDGYLFRPKQYLAPRYEASLPTLNVCVLNKSRYKIKVMEEVKTGYCCANQSWVMVQYPGWKELYVFSDCRGGCTKTLRVIAYDVKNFKKYIGEISKTFSATPLPCVWEIKTEDFLKTKRHSSRPLKAGPFY